MNKIVDRTNEILDILQEELKDIEPVIYFDKSYDPMIYIKTLNPTGFPLILVSYKSSLPNDSKLYPGVCAYEIYFVDIKTGSEELFGLMQSVYEIFKHKIVQTRINGEIVAGHKLIYQSQGYHAESNEHVIYVQKYNLLIP